MNTDQLLEIYKSLFETWRFEVNSHWQRSSYFAAFETVAVAACWQLLSSSVWSGLLLAVGGLCLTTVWYCNNIKTHFYAVYWLEKVAEIEKKLLQYEQDIDFAAHILARPRGVIRHRYLVQAVPVIFGIAWVSLIATGARSWLALHTGWGAMVQSAPMSHLLSYESVSLTLAAGSLLVSIAAVGMAKSSLSVAKEVAARDRRDWTQQKWADMYLKANETYDALERFSVLADSWDKAAWTVEWNNLMRTIRGAHAMAVVFPKSPAIDAFLSATAVFKDEKVVSQERLSQVLSASELIREHALLPTAVLR
jgi:hypothetical protein